MSNPTSNFGWQMPTPVDLVTDLPADFEVFGQAVDSSLADLKGGTTGQILAKATNTDMDFTWVTNDVGDITAVNVTSPITGGGTSGAVTVGIQSASTSQSGAVQLSDSTSTTSSVLAATPTAVKSAYDLANRPNPSNPVLNSAMQVWQRGTSVATAAATAAYVADRWHIQTSALNMQNTVSRQVTNDTTNLANIQYCARVQRDSGQTGAGFFILTQSFETINSIPYVGKTVTLSFYARKGANYSSASDALSYNVSTGTGTDQKINAYTGIAYPINGTATLTSTWQRFTASGTIGTTATEMGVQFNYSTSGTAGAADYFEITGVQIDVGSSALPFRTAGTTYQQELAACQRYYWRTTANSTYTFAQLNAGIGVGNNANTASLALVHPVTMRTVPSTTIEYGGTIALFNGGSAVTGITLTMDSASPQTTRVSVTKTASFAASIPYTLSAWGDAAAYIGLSAEL